jgi:hypothetical protein
MIIDTLNIPLNTQNVLVCKANGIANQAFGSPGHFNEELDRVLLRSMAREIHLGDGVRRDSADLLEPLDCGAISVRELHPLAEDGGSGGAASDSGRRAVQSDAERFGRPRRCES